MVDSQQEWEDEVARYLHNEKVRKNLRKFHDKGKLTDENGNELNLGETVNFEVVEKCE